MRDDDTKVSLLNQPLVWRAQGDSTPLHRWPRARPIHSIIAEALANVELLLAQLEGGVRVADNQRELVRQLYAAERQVIEQKMRDERRL